MVDSRDLGMVPIDHKFNFTSKYVFVHGKTLPMDYNLTWLLEATSVVVVVWRRCLASSVQNSIMFFSAK